MSSRAPSFAQRAGALNSGKPHHIVPFVRAAYEGQRPELLRALVVGINSYLSPADWDPPRGPPSPDWFPRWFQTTDYRFGKRVKAEAMTLLEGLATVEAFAGLKVAWSESVYATNAIKVYLPEADGKRADQTKDELLDEHLSTWVAELDLMATHDVLPHVIAVFGWRFWRHACTSFRPRQLGSFQTLRICTYEQVSGPWRPSIRILRLAGARLPQDTLLVRLRHPSARTHVGSARSLLAQGDVSTIKLGTAHWSEADLPPADIAESYGEGGEFVYRTSCAVVRVDASDARGGESLVTANNKLTYRLLWSGHHELRSRRGCFTRRSAPRWRRGPKLPPVAW
jgi:hypothetical protein